MLSERERHVLNDIERELGTQDPELAERLSGTAPNPSRQAWRYWVAASVVGLLLLISIAADSPIVTLVFTLALTGIGLTGYLRCREHGAG